MPCDTKLKPRQTISQRAKEIVEAAQRIAAELAAGRVSAKVSPRGAIAFNGISNTIRDGLTDACIYRQIMRSGSASAKAAITRAETLAGKTVAKSALAAGIHSHDGGTTWHDGHET